LAETYYAARPLSGGDYEPLGAAEFVGHDDRTLRLASGSAIVEVSALAPDLFRVGMFPGTRPPSYASEAIARDEWKSFETSMRDENDEITLSTPAACAHIRLDPLRLSFADLSGRTFAADDPELGMGTLSREDGDEFGDPVQVYKHRAMGERYFGCGQRTSGLDKTGSYQVFRNVDPPMGHTASFNNLYTSTPFTLSLVDGKAHGIFFDNPARSDLDLAKDDPNLLRYGTQTGNLVYYVFCGPRPRKVVERYTELTGRTPMPPLWALGNQQCRWSYETGEEVREVAKQFRERDIPCDVIYLDIDYMDGFRVFTWDEMRFPNPEKLTSELREKGFRAITIVNPGVKVDENYPVYTDGRDRDLYCKTQEGEEYHNAVWPGVCAFPDFTNPATREWWGQNQKALTDAGVSGIWCDMNEPSLFNPDQATMPSDVVHPGDDEPRLHGELHNAYGSLMARATREGLLELRPEERPFVISRAGYAGLQRYAIQWTGDNSSWWEHLWMSMPQLQNMGLSGVAWAGVDIGGFSGDCDGELLARWYEFGIFQAFCRNHSAKDTVRQEPWAFGEPYESAIRKLLKLRQRLIPHLYTLFEECHRTGAPIVRPLLFEHPEDETTYTADDEFFFGDSILAAPITRPGEASDRREVYLPEGSWFHFWTGERHEGPAHIMAHAPLGEPPVYVRANSPIALGPEMSHTAEKPVDPLTFVIYPVRGSGSSVLYEDAGDGFGYESGEYARRTVACETEADCITVRFGVREGSFVPERREVLLELREVAEPSGILINGEEAEWRRTNGGQGIVVPLGEHAEVVIVEIAL
jgi:alpha-glucosidase